MTLFLLTHQVLAMAAKELSKPVTEKTDPPAAVASSPDMTPYLNDKPHWRQQVEKRIQSNTRHFRKVAAEHTLFF